jgi:hypothetical protein
VLDEIPDAAKSSLVFVIEPLVPAVAA